MKNGFLTICVLSLGLIWLFAFSKAPSPIPSYDAKPSTGEVEQVEGIYIFYRSKPVKEYDYIGTHKISISWTGQPDELFNTLVKKAKKKYPEAQAIIISDDMGKCDAVKFKNTETTAKKD